MKLLNLRLRNPRRTALPPVLLRNPRRPVLLPVLLR